MPGLEVLSTHQMGRHKTVAVRGDVVKLEAAREADVDIAPMNLQKRLRVPVRPRGRPVRGGNDGKILPLSHDNFAWVNLASLLGFAAVVILGCYLTGVPGNPNVGNLFETYYAMFPTMILLCLFLFAFAMCTAA